MNIPTVLGQEEKLGPDRGCHELLRLEHDRDTDSPFDSGPCIVWESQHPSDGVCVI